MPIDFCGHEIFQDVPIDFFAFFSSFLEETQLKTLMSMKHDEVLAARNRCICAPEANSLVGGDFVSFCAAPGHRARPSVG